MKKLTLTVLAVGFAAALQPFANAQFGSGIVFDPTQAGHAVTQIEHEEQSIANEARQIEQGQQIFTNTVKIATTALQAYNVAKQQYELTHQMILAPRMLYARFLSPTSDLLLLQQISNTYGNSMGWLNSANTGKGAASAYQQVSVPNTNNMIPGYGTASMAGQLQIAAQGATVDITDSVMTNNLQVLGTIRANQTARQADIANLETATQTQDPSQQTIMAELQRINQALLLQLRTLQDANQINANLALQQIVAQKQQQDAMKSAFRDSAGYETYYNANVTTTSSGAANLGFSFYKVVAAATMNVLSHVLTNYYVQLGQSMSDPSTMVQTLPLLILLVLVNVYILFKIPTMTHSLFTGGTGGHGGGLGMAMMAIRAVM